MEAVADTSNDVLFRHVMDAHTADSEQPLKNFVMAQTTFRIIVTSVPCR
jgi:hypothetical protein